MKAQNTTKKVGLREPDKHPLYKFEKALANRVNRRRAKVALVHSEDSPKN